MDFIALLTEDPWFDKELDEASDYKDVRRTWYSVAHLRAKLANIHGMGHFSSVHIKNSVMGVPELPNHPFRQFKKDDVVLIPYHGRFLPDEYQTPSSVVKLENAKPDEIRDGINLGIYRDFMSMGRDEFVDRYFSELKLKVPLRSEAEMLRAAEKCAAELAAHAEECAINGHRSPSYFPPSSRSYSPVEEGQCTYCLAELTRPRRDLPNLAITI
jgi:hypothetical protein